MKLRLKEYTDGTPATPEDEALFKVLSIAQLAVISGLMAGVVAAIIHIA